MLSHGNMQYYARENQGYFVTSDRRSMMILQLRGWSRPNKNEKKIKSINWKEKKVWEIL